MTQEKMNNKNLLQGLKGKLIVVGMSTLSGVVVSPEHVGSLETKAKNENDKPVMHAQADKHFDSRFDMFANQHSSQDSEHELINTFHIDEGFDNELQLAQSRGQSGAMRQRRRNRSRGRVNRRGGYCQEAWDYNCTVVPNRGHHRRNRRYGPPSYDHYNRGYGGGRYVDLGPLPNNIHNGNIIRNICTHNLGSNASFDGYNLNGGTFRCSTSIYRNGRYVGNKYYGDSIDEVCRSAYSGRGDVFKSSIQYNPRTRGCAAKTIPDQRNNYRGF